MVEFQIRWSNGMPPSAWPIHCYVLAKTAFDELKGTGIKLGVCIYDKISDHDSDRISFVLKYPGLFQIGVPPKTKDELDKVRKEWARETFEVICEK